MKFFPVSTPSHLTFLLLCVFLFLMQKNRNQHSSLQEKSFVWVKSTTNVNGSYMLGGGHGYVRNAINCLFFLSWPRISWEVSVISEHKFLRGLSHRFQLSLIHGNESQDPFLYCFWFTAPALCLNYMPEHLVFQGLQFLKMSGGGLENITVPNVLRTYEDRPGLVLSHLLVM